MSEELIFKYGFIYIIKPIQPKEENDIYYGSTLRNIYVRMSGHISDYKCNKKYCSSYILLEKYEIHELIIEVVEILKNVTRKELFSRESFYIKNNKCINIQYKNKEILKLHNKKLPKKHILYNNKLPEEQIEYLINTLGFISFISCLNKYDLNNNFKKLFNESDLYKNKIIKFNLVENTSIKKILGHINSILKPYLFKIATQRKRLNGDRTNFYILTII
jgi:hypothetical protein